MADQVSTKIPSLLERLFDPTTQKHIAKRGRAIATAVGEAAETASEQASAAWRDAEPMRQDAARAGRDALRWGERRWRSDVQPGISRLWSRRTAAIGAAGAAVPIAKELFDDAAVRLGIRHRKEERHWGAFFVGMLLGAVAGIVAAMLTAPKAGRQMRDELAVTAKATAKDAAVMARDVAARAREAAATAGEWVPIFQRPDGAIDANGEPAIDEMAIDEMAIDEPAPRAAKAKRSPSKDAVEETETSD